MRIADVQSSWAHHVTLLAVSDDTGLARCALRSAQFDDSLSLGERGDDQVEAVVERSDQCGRATVPKPYPQQPAAIGGSRGQEEEVLVFADDDTVLPLCPLPYLEVRCFFESEFDDVLGFVPPITKVLGQLSRQLVVDKEPHATRITAWFV